MSNDLPDDLTIEITRNGYGRPRVTALLDGIVIAAAAGDPLVSHDLRTLAEHLHRQVSAIPTKRFEAEVMRAALAGAQAAAGHDGAGATPYIRCFGDLRPQEVSWRWTGRLAAGKLTLISGDPGVGKSWLTLAIAAAYTTGAPLPGDAAWDKPMNVLLLNAEDGPEDSLLPRVQDMGADLSRIALWDGVGNGADDTPAPVTLTDHLHVLETLLEATEYGLLIIDPLSAYLGGVDTHRDADLRAVLGPLSQIANRHRVAVIAVSHLTKGSRDRAIYRPQGSIATLAAARVAMLVSRNPDNPEERVVAVVKSNLAELPPHVSFSISDGCYGWNAAATQLDPEVLLSVPSPEERSALDSATEFLRQELQQGSRWTTDLIKAAKSAGISEANLRRAYVRLAVHASRAGGFAGKGRWYWRLPEDHAIPPADEGTRD